MLSVRVETQNVAVRMCYVLAFFATQATRQV